MMRYTPTPDELKAWGYDTLEEYWRDCIALGHEPAPILRLARGTTFHISRDGVYMTLGCAISGLWILVLLLTASVLLVAPAFR